MLDRDLSETPAERRVVRRRGRLEIVEEARINFDSATDNLFYQKVGRDSASIPFFSPEQRDLLHQSGEEALDNLISYYRGRIRYFEVNLRILEDLRESVLAEVLSVTSPGLFSILPKLIPQSAKLGVAQSLQGRMANEEGHGFSFLDLHQKATPILIARARTSLE